MAHSARLRVLAMSLVALAAAFDPATGQEVLAARTLRAGTVIAETDLRWPAAGGAPARERVARLVGLETRRPVYAGRPVNEADLGPPVLVRRNSVVVMTYTDRGLGIRAEGRALEAGGAGETVRVMNLGSRQAVAAVVTGTNAVEVRR